MTRAYSNKGRTFLTSFFLSLKLLTNCKLLKILQKLSKKVFTFGNSKPQEAEVEIEVIEEQTEIAEEMRA